MHLCVAGLGATDADLVSRHVILALHNNNWTLNTILAENHAALENASCRKSILIAFYLSSVWQTRFSS
jgi:hypothetical protein